MANNGGLPLELLDGLGIVLRYLLNPLAGKDLRVFISLLNGLRVIGPARRERCIALLFEERTPAVPAAGEEPEAVDEHDRLLPFRVSAVDLLLFMDRENCHMVLLRVCDLGQLLRFYHSNLLLQHESERTHSSITGGPLLSLLQ